MTAKEIEAMAIGVDTGYRDRNGVPIRVGDEVVYYKKCTAPFREVYDEACDINELKRISPEYIVGTGAQGYVYTGKILRSRHTVTFTFLGGVQILDGNKWKFLYERDDDGNLLTILVDNERRNPKLSFTEVRGEADA